MVTKSMPRRKEGMGKQRVLSWEIAPLGSRRPRMAMGKGPCSPLSQVGPGRGLKQGAFVCGHVHCVLNKKNLLVVNI